MNLSAQKGFAPIFLILGFLIALVGVGGFYYLNQTTLSIPKESPVNTVKPSQFAEGQETKVSGSVIKNYVEGLPIDAPAILTIQTDDGKVEVEYHPGDAECKNTQAGDFGLTIKKGETVEVFGKFSLGRIRTCDSTQYYIHKLNSSNQIDDWKTYTNTTYGYSLQYPPQLYLVEAKPRTGNKIESADALFINELQRIKIANTDAEGVVPGEFIVSVQINPQKYTTDQLEKVYKKTGSSGTNFATFMKNITLGTQPAKEFSVFAYDRGLTQILTVYNNIYSVTYDKENPNDPDFENNKKINQQILSTFKFIDQNSRVNP